MNGSGYGCAGCFREFPKIETLRLWAWCGECRKFRRWPTRWEMFIDKLELVSQAAGSLSMSFRRMIGVLDTLNSIQRKDMRA